MQLARKVQKNFQILFTEALHAASDFLQRMFYVDFCEQFIWDW